MSISQEVAADNATYYSVNPNEKEEWSDRDKREAKEELVDRILDGEVYDENMEYRSDMLIDIETVLVNFHKGKMPRDEAFCLIREAQLKYVELYADSEVENNPDVYCIEEN